MEPVKVKGADLDEFLEDNGCPKIGHVDYYSISIRSGEVYQPCLDIFTSMNELGLEKFSILFHYTVDVGCDCATEVLCAGMMRTVQNFCKHDDLMYEVTKHPIGECPYTLYRK